MCERYNENAEKMEPYEFFAYFDKFRTNYVVSGGGKGRVENIRCLTLPFSTLPSLLPFKTHSAHKKTTGGGIGQTMWCPRRTAMAKAR